jgi:hypothetical protein
MYLGLTNASELMPFRTSLMVETFNSLAFFRCLSVLFSAQHTALPFSSKNTYRGLGEPDFWCFKSIAPCLSMRVNRLMVCSCLWPQDKSKCEQPTKRQEEAE